MVNAAQQQTQLRPEIQCSNGLAFFSFYLIAHSFAGQPLSPHIRLSALIWAKCEFFTIAAPFAPALLISCGLPYLYLLN